MQMLVSFAANNRVAVNIVLVCLSWHVAASGPNNLDTAQTIFQRRCASAGEKIKRTVIGVDGVLLLKLRPKEINYGQQFLFDDPYGHDFSGDAYITSFLRAHHELTGHVARVEGRSVPTQKQIWYRYVEAVDSTDGNRYRYTAFIEQPGLKNPKFSKRYFRVVLESNRSIDASPRYGVTFDDISTKEDRIHWIAGSSLKVIDLFKNEVIAERIGYMIDPGRGNDGGGRSPWLIAASHACPAFGGRNPAFSQAGQAERFVEKVLLPAK